jgi:excisionase family DNA binding protein
MEVAMALEDRPFEEQLTLDEAKMYYTPGEIARHFGVTARTVSNWCDRGRIPFIVTPSGHRRIPVSAVKGGREADQQWQALQQSLEEKTKGLPVPSDEEIASQVLKRRERDWARRSS